MNNEAEYEAILTSLRIAKALGIKNLKSRTDSKLIVGQITNEYEAKEERMKRFLKLMTQLNDKFDDIKFEQIPWENKDGQLLSDSSKAKNVRVRAKRFTVMNGELYKRWFLLPYLKCLTFEEATYVLREIHKGVCGNHSGPRSLVGKMIKVGYFWPTMQKDVVELIKKCDKFQQFGNV